jgi:O-antigen/teichoic acid export membrane protein
MDFFNVASTLLGMAVLVYFDVVSSLTGIIVLGFGYLVSWFFARSKDMYFSHKDIKSVKEELKEYWQYGSWALLGSARSLLQNRGYIYIVSAELGLSDVAEISAARLFLVPIGLLNFSCGKIALAKGSKYLSLNKFKELNRLILYFIVTLTIIGLLYFLFVFVVSDDIVGYLGKKYANIEDLIGLWCIFFFVYTIRVQLATPLTIYSKFREMAKIDIWGSSVAIVSCFIMIGLIGRPGAIISLAIGETLTAILYLNLFIRLRREYGKQLNMPPFSSGSR